MASPDWTRYVDLTVYDQTANDIFNEAIEYGRDVLPEWSPQAGNIEVVVLEAVATEAANVVAAANRVPGAVTETLLKLFGITRSDGDKATAQILVTLTSSSGVHTIPAGTNFAYFPPGNRAALAYRLDDDLLIASGDIDGVGSVTASQVGVEYNEPSAGATLQVLSSIPFVKSVVFDAAPSGGLSPESDVSFFTRAITTLRSYSSALVTEGQIEAWVLTNYPSLVYRCKAYNLRQSIDRDVTDPDFTTHDGHVLVVVAAENADPTDPSDVGISLGSLGSLASEINDLVMAGLVADVENVALVQVGITAACQVLPRYSPSAVQDAVVSALQSYLAPNNWDWSDTVRVNEVIALISSVSGVDFVDGVPTLSTGEGGQLDGEGNIEFDLLGTLPYPGTIDITAV